MVIKILVRPLAISAVGKLYLAVQYWLIVTVLASERT